MLKIGQTSGGLPLTEETFKTFRTSGIEAIEIRDPNPGYDAVDYPALTRLARTFGIELWSFHLPLVASDISKPDEGDAAVRRAMRLIDEAAANGIRKFVIHASAEPISDDERSERLARARENLARLAEFAGPKGAVICVESLPHTCLGNTSDEILTLIGAHEGLRVCLDVNHLREDPVAFVRKVGDRIVTTHISDRGIRSDRHWLPGEGRIDWYEFYRALVRSGYRGVWLYEVILDNSRTITRERPLTSRDLVRNAREIFDGRFLTVMGIPKED